jgi:DNA-binding MarR family transcriptional regulator
MNRPNDISLNDYLKAIGGDQPWIEPVPDRVTSSLPLFLRQRYRFSRTDLFGRKCFLAIETPSKAEPSPTEYAHDVASLTERLSGDVVLVLSQLPAYVRNRLVRQCVPFIVPGTQMFLPMLMIDLREHFPRSRNRSQSALSSVSQLIVIYHVLKEPLSKVPLGQIASRLGYSATAISKARDELQSAELCAVVRSGRSLTLDFNASGKELWKRAEPRLSTPVKRTQWIRWGQPRARAAVAGITALSRYSMLDDDSIPTYAMQDKDLINALGKGEIFGCAGREESEARMEGWKYDPWLTAKDDTADRCSLYLSLRHSADERVQKELLHLLTVLQ